MVITGLHLYVYFYAILRKWSCMDCYICYRCMVIGCYRWLYVVIDGYMWL